MRIVKSKIEPDVDKSSKWYVTFEESDSKIIILKMEPDVDKSRKLYKPLLNGLNPNCRQLCNFLRNGMLAES